MFFEMSHPAQTAWISQDNPELPGEGGGGGGGSESFSTQYGFHWINQQCLLLDIPRKPASRINGLTQYFFLLDQFRFFTGLIQSFFCSSSSKFLAMDHSALFSIRYSQETCIIYLWIMHYVLDLFFYWIDQCLSSVVHPENACKFPDGLPRVCVL